MTAKQTPKQHLQAAAAAMGLSTDGTTSELRHRIDAALEAAADTAEAIRGTQLELPIELPAKPSIHPVNAALFGGVVGAAWHLLG